MSYLKNGILGGIILFIWGFISWNLIPWHASTFNQFQSDVAVSQAIQANAPASGMYLLPVISNANGEPAAMQNQPMVFASIQLEGMPTSMTMQMMIALLAQIIAATCVAWLLSKTNKLTYVGRVSFVVVVALVATLIRDVPAWNWFAFNAHYTLVMVADVLMAWLLAGLVLARTAK